MNFISREANQYNLPKFYDDEVSQILTNLDNSLDAVLSKTAKPEQEATVYRDNYPKKKTVNHHISLGNSYNFTSIAPSFNSGYTATPSFNSGYTARKGDLHRNSDEGKKTKESNIPVVLIVTVSLAIIATCSYFAGKAFGAMQNTNDDFSDLERLNYFIDQTDQQIKDLDTKPLKCKNLPALHHQVGKMKSIASCHEIFSKMKSDAAWDLKFRVGVVAGAVILIVGAILESAPLMVIGVAVMFVSVCGMLIKSGLNSDSKKLVNKINLIKGDIFTIQQTIAKVKNTIGEKATRPAEFLIDEDALYELNQKLDAPVIFSTNYPTWEEDLPDNASDEERSSLRSEYLSTSGSGNGFQPIIQNEFQPQTYYQTEQFQVQQPVYYQMQQPVQMQNFNPYQPHYQNYQQI